MYGPNLYKTCFFVPHSECFLISSATSSCKTCNISTFSMLLLHKKFFWEVSYYICTGLYTSLINVLKFFQHDLFILKFHCFMFLFNFTTSKNSFFRRIIKVWYQCFQIFLVLGQLPRKHFLLASISHIKFWLFLPWLY